MAVRAGEAMTKVTVKDGSNGGLHRPLHGRLNPVLNHLALFNRFHDERGGWESMNERVEQKPVASMERIR